MGKQGDNRERRQEIKEAKREGKSAGEAGLSTGADQQIGHGDQDAQRQRLHDEKGKT
jgi:hypothetical protein